MTRMNNADYSLSIHLSCFYTVTQQLALQKWADANPSSRAVEAKVRCVYEVFCHYLTFKNNSNSNNLNYKHLYLSGF